MLGTLDIFRNLDKVEESLVSFKVQEVVNRFPVESRVQLGPPDSEVVRTGTTFLRQPDNACVPTSIANGCISLGISPHNNQIFYSLLANLSNATHWSGQGMNDEETQHILSQWKINGFSPVEATIQYRPSVENPFGRISFLPANLDEVCLQDFPRFLYDDEPTDLTENEWQESVRRSINDLTPRIKAFSTFITENVSTNSVLCTLIEGYGLTTYYLYRYPDSLTLTSCHSVTIDSYVIRNGFMDVRVVDPMGSITWVPLEQLTYMGGYYGDRDLVISL